MATSVEVHEVVRKTEFAAALGVHKSRPTQLAKQGMPVREDGFLDTRAALDWIALNTEVDPQKIAAARKQLLGPSKKSAEPKRWMPAEVAESGKPSSHFIPVAEAEAQARQQAARIREAARAIPGRIAERLAAEQDPAKAKALLEQEIDRTLNELADILGPGA